MEFGRRIGQFLFFIGVIALVIFWGSYQGGSPSYGLCLSGSAILALGITLLFRNRQAPGESARFRMLRRSRRDKDQRNRL